MEWFINNFLKSLDDKFNKSKYPNQIILSTKQASICEKYMDSRECHSDYGYFNILEIFTENYKYQLKYAGKYIFLTRYKK